MPDKVIEIPGVGNVAFPESMSDVEINVAAAKLHRESQSPRTKSFWDVAGEIEAQRDQRETAMSNPEGLIAAAPVIATGLAGPAIGLVGRSSVPYIAPAARMAATALTMPVVQGTIGAVAGGFHSGLQGALTGGALGMAGSLPLPRVVRGLRNVSRRLNPPAPRVNPNAAASRRMVEGMSRAATPAAAPPVASPRVPPAPVAAPAAAPARAAAPAAPPAAPSAALSSPESPSAPTPRPRMSPQQIQNELGLQARRQKVTLTEAQYTEAAAQVRAGTSPAEAVAQMKAAQPAARPKLTAEEGQTYTRLRRAGKSHQQAIEAIEAQKKLAESLGTPSTAAMKAQIRSRQYKN